MRSVSSGGLTIWLLFFAVLAVSTVRSWSIADKIDDMKEEEEEKEDCKLPVVHVDLTPDSDTFDDSVASEFTAKLGHAAFEQMLKKALLEDSVSCTGDSMDDSTFCLCLPSMPEDTCEEMEIDEIIQSLNKSDCPAVLEIAARKRDNCLMAKLSEYMASLDSANFMDVWESLKSYQDTLISRVPLNVEFDDVDGLEDFVEDTKPEAKCQGGMSQMVRSNMKKQSTTDVPASLAAFASRKQLDSAINDASLEDKKNMLREIRKFKEMCNEDGITDNRGKKADVEERNLRKPDVAIVVSCDYLNDEDWELETAEDVADKLICAQYANPDNLTELCKPINKLNSTEIDDVLDNKAQLCVLNAKCRNASQEIPLNRHTIKCLSPDDLNQTLSEVDTPEELQTVIDMACDSTGMSRDQMKTVADAMTRYLNSTTEEQILRSGCVMKHIPIEELKKAPFMANETLKKSFCQVMATTDQSSVNSSEVHDKLLFCLEAGVPLEEQDELLLAAEPEDISSLTSAELIENPQICHFVCDLDALKEMAAILQKDYGVDLASMDNSSLSAMLPVLLGLDEPTECLPIYKDNYGDLLEVLKSTIDTCTGDIVDVAEARLSSIIELCEQASLEVSTDQTVSPSRKKRQTTINDPSSSELYDCTVVTSDVDVLDRTPEFFSQLNCDVFDPSSACFTTLTEADGYDYNQISALATKVLTCSSADQWTEELKAGLCVVILGMSEETLSNLQFTSDYNIDCVGMKTDTEVNSTLMAPFYTKYLQDNAIAEIGDLTSAQVAEMGILLCGVPTDNIKDFPLYQDMSSTISMYQCFSLDQLTEWAKLEEAVFGSDIDPSDLQRLYYVTAGLSDDIYQKFTDSHIEMIPSDVFSKIPASKLNLLSTTAQCAISGEQAAKIPSDVMEALSSTVSDIITSILDDQVPSACSSVQSPTQPSDDASNTVNEVGDSSSTNITVPTNDSSDSSNEVGDSSSTNLTVPNDDSSDSSNEVGDSSIANPLETGDNASSTVNEVGAISSTNLTVPNDDSSDSSNEVGDSSIANPLETGDDASNTVNEVGDSSSTNLTVPGDSTSDSSNEVGDSSIANPLDPGDTTSDSSNEVGDSSSLDLNNPAASVPVSPDDENPNDVSNEGDTDSMLPDGDDKDSLDSMLPDLEEQHEEDRFVPEVMDLNEIEVYEPPPASYDFKHPPEEFTNLTAEELVAIDFNRVPTASLKELDDEQLLQVAAEICNTPDHDKKAFIKGKIEKIFDTLDDTQIASVMGCVPADLIKSTDVTKLLPMMKDGNIGKNTPQAQMMAEKTSAALKDSLAGGTDGPTIEEILGDAGPVICLMPSKLFQQAVESVKDNSDLLKELMSSYTANCGDRDPARAQILADALSSTVTFKNKTMEQLQVEMINNTEAACAASSELKKITADEELLATAMTYCGGIREQLATRASTSYSNLQKYLTKIDTVSSDWIEKLRSLGWENIDISQGIISYFIPLLKSDYDSITKTKVCTDQDFPAILGYPQVALGSMMYHFCKDVYQTDFAKYKQLGIHAPTTDILQYATDVDVQNLKKAVYMVPKAKFMALSDVANKAFNPTDSSTFEKVQYTLIGLPMSQLNQTKEEDRGVLCDMMACNAITALSPEDIEEKLTFCKQYLNWENFLCAHSPSIKEQFMVAASGLSMPTIEKLNITCADVTDNLVGLGTAVTTCDVRKWLYNCAKEDEKSFTDIEDLSIYAQLIDQMTDEDFDKISDENKCAMWTDTIREESKRRTDLIDFRLNMNSFVTHESCYGVNNNVTKKYVMLMKEACDKLSRRKRQTTGMTCNEFLSYGNNREYLVSAADISSMAPEEFQECIVDIGSTSGFTSEHWQAAADITKQLYGDVSTWTSDLIQEIGGITSGLSIEDLQKLNLADLDAASTVGTTGSWDNDKLTTTFAEFKTDNLGGNMDNINATHLSVIGELNCGATSEDILSIDPKEYCDAADKIGSLKYCEAVQKQAYVELAKDAVCFGDDVTAWSPDIIRLLGTQIGGLTHDDIALLTAEQLAEIDRLAIEQIPPNIINAFSIDQLQLLDPDQISVLTVEQLESLDPEKRDFVVLVQETTSDTDDESSATFVEASTLLVFTVVLAGLLRL